MAELFTTVEPVAKRRWFLVLMTAVLLSGCSERNQVPTPLGLNPDNPHYFIFRGKPAVLIGSTEHYGAVMNLDFDYTIYLNELSANGMNITRTFSGAYVEPPGAFGIKENTLAPAEGRYICPWARSKKPGYQGGGNKFDLSEWDEAYFKRLRDFVTEAGKRDIVVEFDLFSNYYDTLQWKLSPLNSINNINLVGDFKDQKEALSLKHPDLLRVQEEMVRKLVHELKDFDNLYYEVCNEPYFGDTISLRQWEEHMTSVVSGAEKDFRFRHLISNNVSNGHGLLAEPRKAVSVYNFHYAHPPVTVDMNYNLGGVIGDNETGFDGISDSKYRSEAWNFILAGGGLFNNLDYSFTIGAEDGTAPVVTGQPGGGGRNLRKQFRILADFINSAGFISLKPVEDGKILAGDNSNTTVRALQGSAGMIAMYIHRNDSLNKPATLRLELPEGTYMLEWTDTRSGDKTTGSFKNHKGGNAEIDTPPFIEDIALKIGRAR